MFDTDIYKALFELAPHGAAILDAQGKILLANPQLETMFGYPNNALLGQNFDLLVPRLRDKTTKEYSKLTNKKLETKRKSGRDLSIEININIVKQNETNCILVTIKDITEVKNLEDRINRFHQTLDNLLEGVQIVGHDFGYIYVNNPQIRMSSYSRNLLLDATMMEKYPDIQKPEILYIIKKCMNDRVSRLIELGFTYSDGADGWFELNIQPVPEGVIVLSVDITERKKAEEELQKREAQYRLLLDTMSEGVLYVNNDDVLQFTNNRFCELMGYTDEELLGKKGSDIFLMEEEDRLIMNEINKHRQNEIKSSYELKLKTKSGDSIWMHINGSPVKDEHGNVIGSMGTHTDISDRKKVEKELHESLERLKQYTIHLEEIIFSLSHKVRQPVAHILGVSNILDNTINSEAELIKIAGFMKQSAISLDTFTSELTELVTSIKDKA